MKEQELKVEIQEKRIKAENRKIYFEIEKDNLNLLVVILENFMKAEEFEEKAKKNIRLFIDKVIYPKRMQHHRSEQSIKTIENNYYIHIIVTEHGVERFSLKNKHSNSHKDVGRKKIYSKIKTENFRILKDFFSNLIKIDEFDHEARKNIELFLEDILNPIIYREDDGIKSHKALQEYHTYIIVTENGIEEFFLEKKKEIK